MAIALFAIIGATIKAGIAYWICYSLFCVFWFIKVIAELMKD